MRSFEKIAGIKKWVGGYSRTKRGYTGGSKSEGGGWCLGLYDGDTDIPLALKKQTVY